MSPRSLQVSSFQHDYEPGIQCGEEQIGCGQRWQQLARSVLCSTSSDVYAHVYAGVKEDDPMWVTSCSRSPSASCGHLKPGAKWKLRQGGERKHRYTIGKQRQSRRVGAEFSFHILSSKRAGDSKWLYALSSQVTLLSLTADWKRKLLHFLIKAA